MDTANALIGFGGFVAAFTLRSLIAYWNADALKHYARTKFGRGWRIGAMDFSVNGQLK